MSLLKKVSFLLIFVLSFVFLYGIGISSVKADESVDTTTKIKRTIESAPPKVTNTFSYKITPDSNNPAAVTGLASTFDIAFNGITSTDGNCAAEKNINFNSVNYTKPGDYTFNIEEINSSDSISYPLSTDKWKVVLSVRYKMENGVPTRDLITKSFIVEDSSDNKKDDATAIFNGEANFSYIRIYNDTQGNMADLNKYFKVKVDIKGTAGDTYAIVGQDSTIKYNGETITTSNTYTVGSTDQFVFLKDNQDITIGKKAIGGSGEVTAQEDGVQNEIKVGTKYSVQEMGSEAYKTYINNSTEPNKKSPEFTLGSDVGVVRILNVYNAETLTGIILKYLPYLLIVVVAIAMIVIIKVTGRKKEFDLK